MNHNVKEIYDKHKIKQKIKEKPNFKILTREFNNEVAAILDLAGVKYKRTDDNLLDNVKGE